MNQIKDFEKFGEDRLNRIFPKGDKGRGQAIVMWAEIALYMRNVFRNSECKHECHYATPNCKVCRQKIMTINKIAIAGITILFILLITHP